MIIITHNNFVVSSILNEKFEYFSTVKINKPILSTLYELARLYPDQLLVWCHDLYKESLNISSFDFVFHHKRIFATFNPTNTYYLPSQIGYVERSYYLKINKEVTFPTWKSSGVVGGVYASVLLNVIDKLPKNADFEYALNSIAKRGIDEGLFCYSEPKLLKNKTKIDLVDQQASTEELFQFVKQHYKWVWVFFLSICYLIFEKKLTLLSLFKSLFYKRVEVDFNLEEIVVQSTKHSSFKRELDVIIPTIGRKKYLYDVLKDLSKQTILPKNVIIVEQNPKKGTVSELDYLTNQQWPFQIKHTFTHQPGVCNARNIALSKVTSEWTLLGDDDNRFSANLIEDLFDKLEQYGVNVGTTVYIQPHEIQEYFKTSQTSIFGSGNSIVKSKLIDIVTFNTKFEFNYGEDTEFGMQLRNIGEDVIFFSTIKISHLKAPIGGYRTKIKQLWDDDSIQPKPSPTIQLLNQTYFTKQQLFGYKLLLGLRTYKNSQNKNPISYIKYYKKQWERSEFWSNQLKKKDYTKS